MYLEEDVFSSGSRICVLNDSPLNECKGTFLAVHMTATPGEPATCLYLVALDSVYQQEPQWFEAQEVELIGTACEQPAD